MVRIRLFAGLREAAGDSHLEVEAKTVGEAAQVLADRYGAEFSRSMQTARVWRNGEEAQDTDLVSDGDELAFIPPVSGGTAAFEKVAGYPAYLILGIIVVGMLLIGVFGTPALFAAALVAVVAVWAIDLCRAATTTGLEMNYQPVLAAIVISVATFQFELAGLGIGAVLSVAAVMVWAIAQPAARDLTSMAATALGALIASLAVGSMLVVHVSVDGDRKTAGFIIAVAVGVLTSSAVRRMGLRSFDPSLALVPTVLPTVLLIAFVADFPRLGWFFIGLALILVLIASRGLSAAFRTGRVYLTEPLDSPLALLDGPMIAAGLFAPLLWLVT